MRQVGIVPTVRVLLALRRYIPLAPDRLTMADGSLYNTLNRIAVNSILTTILPMWKPILERNANGFSIVYEFFLLGIFMSLFKPLTFMFTMFIFGLILGSIGILFNDSLSNLSYLKHTANFVVDKLESYTNFKVPKVYEANSLNDTLTPVK